MRTENGQPSSRAIALVVALGNLVVCGGIASVLYVLRDSGPQASVSLPLAAPPTTTAYESPPATWDYPSTEAPPSTTRTSEQSIPSTDFRQVTGSGGMTTYIPATWPTKTATGPGSTQADDVEGMARVLRYGGSPTSVTDSYAIHADYERQFSANKVNFVSIRLDSATVRGMSAIDWEFEYDVDGVRRHVRSVYWLSSGYEYFVYASAPVEFWPDTQPILDVMLDHATP